MKKDTQQNIEGNINNQLPVDLFNTFINSFVDHSKKQLTDTLEPFEFYVDKQKTKLYANPPLFLEHFTKGYLAILKQLEEEFHNFQRSDDL